MSEIRNKDLWQSGQLKIDWVRAHMPLLNGLEQDFSKTKPFSGLKIALSVHMEAKTAYLCQVLAAGGAQMYATGCNPLSTQDDVAAALDHSGINVFALHAATPQEYEHCLEKVLEIGPNIIIDDGGDLGNLMLTKFRKLIPGVIGGCEETTTGIHRLLAMEKDGTLRFPVFAVNDAQCKHLFDNRYGTGQSVFDGIDRTTNLIVAGKTVVVAGYGWCGRGVAMRAKGLGARVIVTEIDPVKAIEAVMDGFTVMRMAEAAKTGDVFITVTGMRDVITQEHMKSMKNGVLLCNAGHFDVEIDVAALRKIAVETREMKPNITGYRLENGNWLYLLAEGRLVNLASGDGHPAEIMDMSFAIQALCARELALHAPKEARVYAVPEQIDEKVATEKLGSIGAQVDVLTDIQKEYANSWKV